MTVCLFVCLNICLLEDCTNITETRRPGLKNVGKSLVQMLWNWHNWEFPLSVYSCIYLSPISICFLKKDKKNMHTQKLIPDPFIKSLATAEYNLHCRHRNELIPKLAMKGHKKAYNSLKIVKIFLVGDLC